jgi:NAD(P)H-hydrate epimerase
MKGASAMEVVTVAEMREIEQRAEREYGLTSPVLMEHAGRSIAEHTRDWLGGGVEGRSVLILAGPGNNGGDGLVMGRHLARWGARVAVYHWKARELEMEGERVSVAGDEESLRRGIVRAEVVADALLGTGHSRPLDPTMGAVLALVEAERARRPELRVLAVDLPSGLNADTGALDPGAIRADLTVTLACPKVGLLLFPGAGCVGELRVGSIGLPAEMTYQGSAKLLDDALVRGLLPPRPLDANKGTFGKVLVVAGSPLYVGAAYLATAAAARVGAGLVTLATTPERAPFYAMLLPEATYALLPEGATPEARAEAVLAELPGRQAAIIGPGLGHEAETAEFLRRLLAGIREMAEGERPRLVVDADGLNLLAREERWWELLPPRTVLTPHPGEMARLRGGAAVSGGGADRLAVAREAARAWGQVVVLKGACTLIAAPEGTVGSLRVNWPPNPALASAGTGDVLAGTIGGLLAKGVAPFDAASAGVYLHSRAGLRVRARLGEAGALAGDLLPELPVALRAVREAARG